jgi:hypothetical protein
MTVHTRTCPICYILTSGHPASLAPIYIPTFIACLATGGNGKKNCAHSACKTDLSTRLQLSHSGGLAPRTRRYRTLSLIVGKTLPPSP